MIQTAQPNELEVEPPSDCDHEWVEQEGEPPVDACIHCGAQRE